MPRDVHLVGSVPWRTRGAVFETVSAALGPRLKRIPDGETGERADWITWLEPVFAEQPGAGEVGRVVPAACHGNAAHPLPPQAGRMPAGRALRQPVLRRHRASLIPDFARLKRDRQDPARLPLPDRSGAGPFGDLAFSCRTICMRRSTRSTTKRSSARSTRSRRRCRTTRSRSSSTSHPRCSRGSNATTSRATAEQGRDAGDLRRILIDLANHVPADIELLFHFCYGDFNHKHVVEPTDMADMVEMANRLADGSRGRSS